MCQPIAQHRKIIWKPIENYMNFYDFKWKANGLSCCIFIAKYVGTNGKIDRKFVDSCDFLKDPPSQNHKFFLFEK